MTWSQKFAKWLIEENALITIDGKIKVFSFKLKNNF